VGRRVHETPSQQKKLGMMVLDGEKAKAKSKMVSQK
jgi:hypothetical protein